jgi:hypothetical protein
MKFPPEIMYVPGSTDFESFTHNGLRLFRFADGTFGFGNTKPLSRGDIATLAAFASSRAGTEQGLRDARQDILSALELVSRED